ncbi:hypothetical protein ACFC0X_19730 [Paenibacillus chitinolyticus]|uniref:hypothetical protein n=1 Tax=Paenibacillus chitinolyticus TaxID=79263 RepID=UPI0035E186DA
MSMKLMLSGIFIFLLTDFMGNTMGIKLHLLEIILPLLGMVLFVSGIFVKSGRDSR